MFLSLPFTILFKLTHPPPTGAVITTPADGIRLVPHILPPTTPPSGTVITCRWRVPAGRRLQDNRSRTPPLRPRHAPIAPPPPSTHYPPTEARGARRACTKYIVRGGSSHGVVC